MNDTIGYARVSTTGQTLAAQRDALSAAGCSAIYEERISGARSDRPELHRMLADLRPGQTILVTRLDRLARSVTDLLGIIEIVAARGAHLRSLADPWLDTGSPAGRLVLTVFGAIAEFERHLIRERTHEGRSRAKAAGRSLGRPSMLSSEQVAEAAHLRAAGLTQAQVARRVGASRAAVQRAEAAAARQGRAWASGRGRRAPGS